MARKRRTSQRAERTVDLLEETECWSRRTRVAPDDDMASTKGVLRDWGMNKVTSKPAKSKASQRSSLLIQEREFSSPGSEDNPTRASCMSIPGLVLPAYSAITPSFTTGREGGTGDTEDAGMESEASLGYRLKYTLPSISLSGLMSYPMYGHPSGICPISRVGSYPVPSSPASPRVKRCSKLFKILRYRASACNSVASHMRGDIHSFRKAVGATTRSLSEV